MTGLPHQDRNTFDAKQVLAFVRQGLDAPTQGWFSLVEEACIRLLWMENRIAAAKDAADVIQSTAKKLRDETWWS